MLLLGTMFASLARATYIRSLRRTPATNRDTVSVSRTDFTPGTKSAPTATNNSEGIGWARNYDKQLRIN
eukprot:COSAG02_NODE_54064_length_298_cov_0.773869_1_plen_68_part_01